MQWLIKIIYALVIKTFRHMIVVWSGAIVDIPEGWHLCDGTEGTPNLRDQFVIGAGDAYAVGDTGGDDRHGHHYEIPAHTHDLVSGIDVGTGPFFNKTTSAVSMEADTFLTTTLPPYYALAYIMKL